MGMEREYIPNFVGKGAENLFNVVCTQQRDLLHSYCLTLIFQFWILRCLERFLTVCYFSRSFVIQLGRAPM